MHILEITIQRQTENRWPVVIEHRTPNNLLIYRNGDLHLDTDKLLAQVGPHDYGKVLGEALFHGTVRDTFTQALHQAGDNYLRVLLHVESERLRPLRWERLCAPFATGWDMLLLNQHTLFVHYLPSMTERRFRPFGRADLRALVLVASPVGLTEYGMTHFDAPAAARRIKEALGKIPCDLLVNDMPEAVGPATLKAMARQLMEKRYTLVHFVAHGKFSSFTGDTALFLADEQNQIDRVDSEEMLAQLRSLNPENGFPHFTFLGTCDTAAPEAENAMGGLAQRLVRDLGMPAVLAMTEQVSITTLDVLTTAFYQRLREHGEADRALVEATTTIDTPHHDITVPALYTRLEGRPLFSHDLSRPLTETEILHGLEEMTTAMEARAPVLLQDLTPLAQELKRDPMDPLKLAPISQLCQDTLDISFSALAMGSKLPEYDARCPFQGLAAFDSDDKDFFFGRDDLVEELAQRLHNHSFLAVSGPSGSGKSSLILAGVVPALQAQTAKLTCFAMTPGTTPLKTLDNLLAQDANPDLLFIDQFEELFTLCTDKEERDAFVQQLLALSEQEKGPTLILALRDDFWADCQAYPRLYSLMEEHRCQIEPMPVNLLRSAMEQQASAVGLRFEAGLSNMLLDDVTDEPGAMPLLQHGLKELWQHRHGRWLRVSEYEAIGGIKKAIARTAERIYNGCTTSEKALMQNIMLRLVRLEEDTPADAQPRDTRRRTLLSELTPLGGDEDATRGLVNRLADESLVVTKRIPATDQVEVEIAHEAIISYWGQLRDWLRGDREVLVLRQRISNGARVWREKGQDRGLLLRGQALHEARGLAKLNPAMLNENEHLFISKSQQQQWLSRLVPAAIVVLALAVAGWFAYRIEPEILFTEALETPATSFFWDDDDETLYVGLYNSGQVTYREKDGQWHEAKNIAGNYISELIADSPDTFYALSGGAPPAYITTDGEKWDRHMLDIPKDVDEISRLAISPSEVPHAVYIGDGDKPGIYTCPSYTCTSDEWVRVDEEMESGVRFMKWMGEQLLVSTQERLFVSTPEKLAQRDPNDRWTELLRPGEPIYTAIEHGEKLYAGGSGLFIFHNQEHQCVIEKEKVFTHMTLFEQTRQPIIIASTHNTQLYWWYASDSLCPPDNDTIRTIPLIKGDVL